MRIESLKHAVRPLPGGGMVLVLDTGAIITPEADAMLQALYSRSVEGVLEHLDILAKRGSDKFMGTFYVGYGHKSIGDCGTGTIFIEGVSMIAAKAIQDWALYSGQEASTRYIDFSTQPFIDPVGTEASRNVHEMLRSFYMSSMDPLVTNLTKRFPQQEGEKDGVYKKAIEARAFDIMRGFLPAGASTKLAWHSNLRQMADKLMLLRHHPLQEVQQIAEAIEDALLEAYPNSFGHKRYGATEEYNKWWPKVLTFASTDAPYEFELAHDGIDREQLAKYRRVMECRPEKTDLPKIIGACGTLQFRFMLDYGSFRDIQRHRAVIQTMPLITDQHGFGEWYLGELPDELRVQAVSLLVNHGQAMQALAVSPLVAQYYTPMGFDLPLSVTGALPALVYLVELRCTRFVHPTLRRRAIQMAESLLEQFGDCGLVIHLDDEPDRFDVKRGEHDIVKVVE